MSETVAGNGPRWPLLLTLGILACVAGIIAILAPQLSTLAVNFVIGGLLVFDGILQGVHAADMRGRRGFAWRVVMALLALAVGALLLANPAIGIVSLTLVVALFFLLGGTLKLSLAWRLRPADGWGLLAFAGGLSLLLGVVILAQLPDVAAWVLGLLVGLDLLFAGTWLITVALAARRRLTPG